MSVFSDSKMAPVHYILGVYFYTALGPTALLHLNSGTVIFSLVHLQLILDQGMYKYYCVIVDLCAGC